VSTPQVVALLQELDLYSRTPGIYIIYGAPAVGKTTLMARFVWELAELGVPTFYVGTEPNLKLYGQLEKIREKLPRVFKCGYREIATVEYADSYLPLLHKAVEVTGHCGEAVLVVDSITAIALHEQSRYLAATGKLDVLPIVRTMSSFANVMTQIIANNIASKAISVYFVAQERPAIGQTYHGEPAAPSFAMRAQHNVQAVARLTVSAEGKRTLKVVWHRISKHTGTAKEIHIEPLL
jgi:KaiC/GvpD/RAD55 family RecA-like ATPase